MARLRIFVTTSHISSVFMTLHASATHRPEDVDVQLVDGGARRRAVIEAIRGTARLHPWALMHSCSTELVDEHGPGPSLLKRLTRKWKEAPILRSIYGVLLRRHAHRRQERDERMLRTLLAPLGTGHTTVELHLHTQNHLEAPLRSLFPEARPVFFEHGLGDYHYLLEHGRMRGPLIALFADRFAGYLARQGQLDQEVRPILLPPDLHGLMIRLLEELDLPSTPVPPDRRLVFVLLEAVDMYEVPHSFWAAYIDHVLSALPDHRSHHFLFKPHPAASTASLEATVRRCTELGLSFTLMTDPKQMGIAAEVLFAAYADRTDHVFCLFSSACFYLSRLYPSPHIAYHYSTSWMERWTGNAPPMYRRHFAALKPLIEQVFAERCVPY